MAVNVTKCPKCNRLVPPKGGVCLYCGTSLLGGATSVAPEEPRSLGAKNSRFKPQGDDRTHYLLGDARDPVSLEAGKLFVLGRDPRTSLHVHAPDVSRQHAEIDWQGDPARPVLCEVRSKNGTFLNDKRVTRDAPQPLRNGDRIRLGENFELLYLHVAERDMKRELQDRSQEETRELRVGPGRSEPTPPPAEPAEELREVGATPSGRQPRTPAAAKRPGPPEPPARGLTMAHGRKAQPVPTGDELDALVNAALGEAAAEPGAGPIEGDLSQTSGSDLLRQLVAKKATGVLTVFDGAQTGEIVLKDGQSTQVTFGKVTGRPALTAIVRLRRGSFRFRPGAGTSEDPTALDAGLDVPADGNLSQTPARELIKALLARKKTGALTIFDGQDTGEVTLVEGVVEHAALGGHVGREALNAIVALEQGAYRFRSDGDTGRIATDDLTAGDAAWSMPMPQPIGAPPPPPARPTPPPVTSSQAARRNDAWDVDPDDTLMPAEFSGAAAAPPAPTPRAPSAPPAPFKEARPADARVNPLRSPRNATDPPPTRPSRPSMPALPQNPPAPPASGPAPSTDPRRTGPQPRRAPPPLPPRDGPSGPGSDRHRRP